jgi:zinc transport system substrate-binding protein
MALAWLLIAGARGPAEGPAAGGKPVFVATIQPLAMILREVAGDRAEIVCLLPAGASPHTFSPRPSDAAACQRAARVYMVTPQLDGWASRLAPAEKRIAVLGLLPEDRLLRFAPGEEEHDHEGEAPGAPASAGAREDEAAKGVADPHFWTDPLAVKAILPSLADSLAKADPEGAEGYRAGAARFAAALDALDSKTRAELAPVAGRAMVLMHPSFRYLAKRYGLKIAGSVEQIPGKDPTPREIVELAAKFKAEGARAIFTEPQLSPRPAEVIAETAGARIGTLDPNGGEKGKATYAELIEFNARALAEGLL